MNKKIVSKADFKHFLDSYPAVLEAECFRMSEPAQWLFKPKFSGVSDFVCGYTVEKEPVYWIAE